MSQTNLTTLCYIEEDDCYLIMHRISKKNDMNAGKWIGVGGGFEDKENRTFFEKVRDLFMDMLREAKIAIGYNITDNDLRYMLWRTYQMQKSKGVMAAAEDVLMQQKLGVGNFRTRPAGTRQMTEEEQIIADAKAHGTYLKAPNGKKSNLTPKQWVQVRTKAFKEWFGDWEKAARIEKLRSSEPIKIKFNNEYELNRIMLNNG